MPLSASITPPLHAAAFDGDVEAVQHLLADLPPNEELWTDRGTPLHFAVQGDCTECVQLLLDAGLEIDAENGDGITPLMQAAVMGHEQVLVVLLDHGASIPKAFLPGSSESLLHFCVEHVRPTPRTCSLHVEYHSTPCKGILSEGKYGSFVGTRICSSEHRSRIRLLRPETLVAAILCVWRSSVVPACNTSVMTSASDMHMCQ